MQCIRVLIAVFEKEVVRLLAKITVKPRNAENADKRGKHGGKRGRKLCRPLQQIAEGKHTREIKTDDQSGKKRIDHSPLNDDADIHELMLYDGIGDTTDEYDRRGRCGPIKKQQHP